MSLYDQSAPSYYQSALPVLVVKFELVLDALAVALKTWFAQTKVVTFVVMLVELWQTVTYFG